jgi:hypothetical protein
MASEEKNAREFSRVPVKVRVLVRSEGIDINSKRSIDLSMNGIFVECDEPLPLGTKCELTILLDGTDPMIRAECGGIIRRVAPEGMAIEFVELTLESYEHLQNLVRFNAPNLETVENELKEHLGLIKRT